MQQNRKLHAPKPVTPLRPTNLRPWLYSRKEDVNRWKIDEADQERGIRTNVVHLPVGGNLNI